MARPKRSLLATAQETSSPPASLEKGHVIARVGKAEGKNLYSVERASITKPLLVELASPFRSRIWIKRGGYVVVDTEAFADRDNKLDGEIVNIVRDEKVWRKQSYWPTEFAKKSSYPEDSEDENSNVGRMPPSDDSDSRDCA
ncbi:MAG: hypothetical protein Q9170_004445 [Blastenia crenularia]